MAWPTHIVAAAGFVEDGAGNILLVKTYARGWDAPGGQIEMGENIEEGVLREILEESGITASVRQLVGIYSNVSQYLAHDGMTNIPTKVMFDFRCDYVSGQPVGSEETSEAIWVPKAKVLEYITAPAQYFRFQKLLAFTGKVFYCSYITRPEFHVMSDRYV